MFNKGLDTVKDLGNDAVSAAGGALNEALDIPDFYSAHLMTFCQGDFTPDAKDPNAEGVVTECSVRKAFYNFDPTAIIESKLPDGVGLSDLQWPDDIANGLKAVSVASKAMFFFYIVGIAAAGIGMIGAVFGLLAYEHKVALANLGVNSVSSASTLLQQSSELTHSQLGFICLGLASAMATVIIYRVTDAINDSGAAIGLEADRGTAFLGMTWTATILMLLATIGWVGEFLMGRRSSNSYYKQEPYYS